jgi:putative ABC transport system permease protein
VAVFLAVSIANRSAAESFRNAFGMVTGRADLEIRGILPEILLPRVLECPGVAGATPLVEAMVTLPDHPGESLRLAGIDPFTAEGLLGFPLPAASGGGDLATWLEGGTALAVTPEFLRQHGMKPGEEIRLQGPGAPRMMRITHVIGGEAAVSASASVAAVDIATAQEWTGHPGQLSAILVRLAPGERREDVAARLRRLAPGDATVDPPSRRTRRVEAMLAAFRLNLTALSLVSLLVGMFFVGNTASASVIRRRVSLGILRAVGASVG